MSYGAISVPAIQALSKGARMAGCWLNTGRRSFVLPFSRIHQADGINVLLHLFHLKNRDRIYVAVDNKQKLASY